MAASTKFFALALLCYGVISAPAPAPAPAPVAAPKPAPVTINEALQLENGVPQTILQSSLPAAITPLTKRKLHGKFLHITDFHPDEFYKVHTSTSAEDACHSGRGPAGTYGAETSDCDSPISLVNATFDWIAANIADDIDFIIWTGDSARHDSDETIPRSPNQVLGTNRLLASKFVETFSDPSGLSIPVIPTFGNNDILPHNILLPGPNKWLQYYADIWKKFIPEEQRHSFEFGGWFYVEVIPNKLAVFSLNSLYFFDRNAGVDDCQKPSEPGFKQMEWLRVQLQFMRQRGMKAILMGHVPPARTDSKQLWDETCWQKYTLWLKRFRDVVVGSIYGHMNIDHFLLQDTKQIDIRPAGVASEEMNDFEEDDESEDTVSTRESMEDELSVQSATDYLEELRQGWAKLPKPELYRDVEFESEKNKKKKDKKKKGKKDKNKKKIGGEWAERYQLSLVSPSIVPNYFPTIRVIEYNITGLENTVTWADSKGQFPVVEMPDPHKKHSDELELRSLPDVEAEKKKDKKEKSKHPEKPKKDKQKKDKKPRDPHLVVPDPPAKSSLPGPAYSPQPLTFIGYTQYYANLTFINNDIVSISEDELKSDRWREGKHGGKKPHRPAKPHPFEFHVEYTTFDHKLYNMTDLTVKSFVELAYRMGQKKNKSNADDLLFLDVESTDEVEEPDLVEDQDQDEEDFESESDGEEDSEDEDGSDDEADHDLEVDKKKHNKDKKKDKKKGKNGDKKKKKKKKKAQNKMWLHFLNHAFVSTVDEDELKHQFS